MGVDISLDRVALAMIDMDCNDSIRHRLSEWEDAVLESVLSIWDMSDVYCWMLSIVDCMTVGGFMFMFMFMFMFIDDDDEDGIGVVL